MEEQDVAGNNLESPLTERLGGFSYIPYIIDVQIRFS